MRHRQRWLDDERNKIQDFSARARRHRGGTQKNPEAT